MQTLTTSIRAFITLAILLGLVYPFFILGISNIIFPYQARGSLLKYHDKIIGSALIAQNFTSPKYFHSRFSSIDYNAAYPAKNNLAPANKKLIERTQNYIKLVRTENNLHENLSLPADMILESSSGLDPHISFANAGRQLLRVAKHRGLPENKIKKLIRDNIDPDFIGIWGQAGVNVLKLNLSLDIL